MNTKCAPAPIGSRLNWYIGAFFMIVILLTVNILQALVRNFFANPLRRLKDFFANLRRTCEGFANVPKLSL